MFRFPHGAWRCARQWWCILREDEGESRPRAVPCCPQWPQSPASGFPAAGHPRAGAALRGAYRGVVRGHPRLENSTRLPWKIVDETPKTVEEVSPD